MAVHFVYLDEFGHIGPYFGRGAKRFNESPVFGLAGVVLPETAVRPFATKFLQLKEHIFRPEIKRSGKIASQWEKKIPRWSHLRPNTGFTQRWRTKRHPLLCGSRRLAPPDDDWMQGRNP